MGLEDDIARHAAAAAGEDAPPGTDAAAAAASALGEEPLVRRGARHPDGHACPGRPLYP
eukprot:COSAG02_NODE_1418_length_12720_cov_20.079629_10_plen_59_part_00